VAVTLLSEPPIFLGNLILTFDLFCLISTSHQKVALEIDFSGAIRVSDFFQSRYQRVGRSPLGWVQRATPNLLLLQSVVN